jgi:hypothetical protein
MSAFSTREEARNLLNRKAFVAQIHVFLPTRFGEEPPDDSFPEESCDRGAKPAKKMTRPESFPIPPDAEPISTAALPATAALEPLFMNGTIPEQM